MDSKLPDIGTTIFTVMSKMAADHDAINLSQGYPDFSVPAALAANLARHVAAGHNQYPPMHGVAALRDARRAAIWRITTRATARAVGPGPTRRIKRARAVSIINGASTEGWRRYAAGRRWGWCGG